MQNNEYYENRIKELTKEIFEVWLAVNWIRKYTDLPLICEGKEKIYKVAWI